MCRPAVCSRAIHIVAQTRRAGKCDPQRRMMSSFSWGKIVNIAQKQVNKACTHGYRKYLIMHMRRRTDRCFSVLVSRQYDRPAFRDGLVSTAVDAAVSSGSLYFSAAGNSGAGWRFDSVRFIAVSSTICVQYESADKKRSFGRRLNQLHIIRLIRISSSFSYINCFFFPF